MRFFPVLIMALALTGCELINQNTATAPANVGPLTGREQALIYGADGAFQQGNYVAAERDYLAAAAASTGRVDAHLALARLYQKQQLPEKAHDILMQALQLQPNHPLANYFLGKSYLDANEYSKALAAFQRGRTTHADDVDLSIGEAVTQDMLGHHGAAQTIYQHIISANPTAKLDNVRTNLGMSYLLSGDPQKAVEVLKVEAKKPGASQVARHNLALAYGMLGKNTDAKTVLNGDMDEETRMLVLARLKEYRKERVDDATPPPIRPTISEAKQPEDAAMEGVQKPAPIINKERAKPVVKKKPVAVAPKKPVVAGAAPATLPEAVAPSQ